MGWSIENYNPFTVSFDIKYNGNYDRGEQIFDKGYSYGGNPSTAQFFIETGGGLASFILYSNDSIDSYSANSDILNYNEWTNIALTYDGSDNPDGLTYQNGIPEIVERYEYGNFTGMNEINEPSILDLE